MRHALPLLSSDSERAAHYARIVGDIEALIEGIDDEVAIMATVACELHHGFAYYHWTGFYRRVAEQLLRVGPYQGGHGCLEIALSRGVCGAAARSKQTQLVADVELFEGHIACSTTTRSEIVVPLIDARSVVVAVLDVDSDDEAAFREVDQAHLERLCALLAERWSG